MTLPSHPTIGQIVRGYLLLPHAVPIIVVMTATAAFALVAEGGWPGSGAMIRLLGAMFGGQIAIGAVNELVDVELDRQSKPHKPIPAGLVSARGAWIMTISGLIVMALLSATFGAASLLLCSLGTGTGVAYSVWFKRTIWSWIPYLIALPLLPIWVWTALDTVDAGLLAIYPIGAAAVISVQLAQSLPDVDSDRLAGVKTLAVALGSATARNASWGAMLIAALLTAALAPWLTPHPWRVWIAALLAGGLVLLNVAVWRRNDRTGVMASFPCMAASAVILGVGWTTALVG